MRILFLTQVLPYPLDAGPKVRAYYVLRHLAQKHTITLVSFVRPTDTRDAINHLSQFCARIHTVTIERGRWRDGQYMLRSLLTNKPFLIIRDQQPAMSARLASIIREEQFDAIHADQLWMAPYALATKALAPYQPAPITVLDQHNAVFMIPRRMSSSAQNPLKRQLLNLEATKLARYEREVCSQIDKVVWVTQDDYDAVARSRAGTVAPQPPRNSGVIPICTESDADELLPRSPNANRVTFLGGLHYPPNAEGVMWFANEVFPSVLANVPNARLTVIGKQPPAALADCNIPAANLDVTGYVDDPRPYLSETAAFIVPILAGGGMRVKILDGWKWGVPVISTTIGAEGIQVTPTQDILIADNAKDFATATVSLLRDSRAGKVLAGAAQATLSRAYNWQSVYRGWDSVYASAL